MLFLSKIHLAKYIDDMYENEYLYFNSLLEFRSSTIDKTGRLDPKELNLKNTQLATLTFLVDCKEIHLHNILKDFNGQLMEHLTETKINCCSLHWLEIEPEETSTTFHEKLLLMGDKMILIFDCEMFFKILDSSIEKLGMEYSRKKVIYYDPKMYNGKLSLHHKDKKYEFQNEYRILISPTDNRPIKLPLPGLKKICHVIETKHYEKMRIQIK